MNTNTEEEKILCNCITRWNDSDEKIIAFQSKLPQDLEQLSPQMREILVSLLEYFDYYSHQTVNGYLKQLHTEAMSCENVELGNSVFCVLKSQRGTINSSYEYLIEYRHLNGISKYSIVPDLHDIDGEYLDNIENVILLDDFCGSGKTFLDYLKNNKELFSGKHVIYIVIHIMEEALERIREYAEENQMNIDVVSSRSREKAFSITDALEVRRECFKAESQKLGLHKDMDIYGYSCTESLVAFFNDTPNNTLGIFWKNTDKNDALFPRNHEEKPAWMKFRENKKERMKSNYIRKKAGYRG